MYIGFGYSMFDEVILSIQALVWNLMYSVPPPPGQQVEKLENQLLSIQNQKDEATKQDLLMFIKSMPENQLKVIDDNDLQSFTLVHLACIPPFVVANEANIF